MSRSTPNGSKPIIGIAGGIGAGKSTVARMLQELGAAVIVSDRLAHQELSDPQVIGTLRQWWGEGVCLPTGEIDREAVARIVFERAGERQRLEELIYPRIERRRLELMARYDAEPGVKAIVLDAPKLFEVGLNEICDAVIFVAAEKDVRLQRVGTLRGWSEAELDRREKMQDPLDNKRANADYVVTNHSSIEALRSQVENVFASILASFA